MESDTVLTSSQAKWINARSEKYGRGVRGISPRGAAERGRVRAVQEGRGRGERFHRVAHLRAGARREGHRGRGAAQGSARRRARIPEHARGHEAEQGRVVHLKEPRTEQGIPQL